MSVSMTVPAQTVMSPQDGTRLRLCFPAGPNTSIFVQYRPTTVMKMHRRATDKTTWTSRSGRRTVVGAEPARRHEHRAVTQIPLQLGLHGRPLCRGHLAPRILHI